MSGIVLGVITGLTYGLLAVGIVLVYKASRFIKAELKRAGIGDKELAEKLNAHGLEETKDSIAAKLMRGTFPVTFFLAVLTVLELEEVSGRELMNSGERGNGIGHVSVIKILE